MQTPKREPSRVALPPALIYAAATTCGVLAALALQIYSSNAAFELAGLWENLFASGARELRTAGPWWGTVGVAFVTSGIAAAALSRFPPPWQRFRLLRWVAAAVIVLALAQIGHPSAPPEAVGAGVNVAVSLVALLVAAAMALLGAHVAVRR
ncbi:MAG TPA: hypothetical protein VE801_17150 [Xanthobacteraceae bacterium]|nr:hypothetical protein [Xanthobacteraceae bacterium]